MRPTPLITAICFAILGSLLACQSLIPQKSIQTASIAAPTLKRYVKPDMAVDKVDPKTAATIQSGMTWLIKAQSKDGGWGAGSHHRQGIHDPHAVSTDPATTAFASMALLRAGHTLQEGAYKDNLKKGLIYLLEAVENAPANSNSITDRVDTQPQRKLGRNVDVSMTSQFLSRILPHATYDQALANRIKAAQGICIQKLEQSVTADGSVSGGTWAGVLQSASVTTALEEAAEAGYEVDTAKLDQAREYQRKNVDVSTGSVSTESAAGVALYAVSSTSRATAKEARRAKKLLKKAKEEGKIEVAEADDEIEVSVDNLEKSGVDREEAEQIVEDYRANEVAKSQAQDARVMSGFGNNGGEEFYSHLMTSEAMVVEGGEAWDTWKGRIFTTLGNIQNPDGSWSGHHCITSPVFCTAAVLQTLTVENDTQLLAEEDQQD